MTSTSLLLIEFRLADDPHDGCSQGRHVEWITRHSGPDWGGTRVAWALTAVERVTQIRIDLI